MYVLEEALVREELLKRYYNNPLAGYFGVDKTFELISRKYFWKSIKADIKEYMDSYDICQRVKVKRYRPYGKLYTLLIPSGPWKEITINFITDLPPSKCKGSIYDSILVIVDRYTKIACYLLTIKKLNAVQLEELLIREIFLKFSILEGIVTNRRTLFTSAFWLEVCYQI